MAQKKQSFLHGAALLAGAAAAVKIIGAFYKIPLNAIIGTKGFSYFNTAYDIYTLLLMASTAGLPVAMSQMISSANSLNNTRQVKRIYRTAQAIFLILGIAGGILMTCFSHQLADFQKQPDAWAAIACLGPSATLVCLMAAFRGFFQGHSNMKPTAISQVIEALCKLLVGLTGAWLMLKLTNQIPLAAGGAILGVTSGCMASTVYLFLLFRKDYAELDEGDLSQPVLSYGETAKGLLSIAIPITISSAGVHLISMLEVKVFMTQLLGLGFTQDASDVMKGIYNMAQTIFNMPCAFIPAITISAMPNITSQLTLGRHDLVRSTEESASRITSLIAMPCAFGLVALSKPVMALLGGYTGEELVLAGYLMAILAVCIIFNTTVMLTNAIMQAHGKANIPAMHIFIGGALKLTVIYLLTGNRDINICGVPMGTVSCYFCITLLNLNAMRRYITDPPHIVRNMLKPLAAAAIMTVPVLLTHSLLGNFFTLGSTLGKLMLCGVPIAIGVVVYVIAVIMLKAITREDCLLLPKGEKIAKLLHL